MSINVLQLMNAVVSDCQSLLDESAHNERVRRYIDDLLNVAQFIRDELNLYVLPDGSVEVIPISSGGSYTRTPFAKFETHIYLMKKLNGSGTIELSNEQIERLESMDTTVKSVRKRLNEIWGLEN